MPFLPAILVKVGQQKAAHVVAARAFTSKLTTVVPVSIFAKLWILLQVNGYCRGTPLLPKIFGARAQ